MKAKGNRGSRGYVNPGGRSVKTGFARSSGPIARDRAHAPPRRGRSGRDRPVQWNGSSTWTPNRAEFTDPRRDPAFSLRTNLLAELRAGNDTPAIREGLRRQLAAQHAVAYLDDALSHPNVPRMGMQLIFGGSGPCGIKNLNHQLGFSLVANIFIEQRNRRVIDELWVHLDRLGYRFVPCSADYRGIFGTIDATPEQMKALAPMLQELVEQSNRGALRELLDQATASRLAPQIAIDSIRHGLELHQEPLTRMGCANITGVTDFKALTAKQSEAYANAQMSPLLSKPGAPREVSFSVEQLGRLVKRGAELTSELVGAEIQLAGRPEPVLISNATGDGYYPNPVLLAARRRGELDEGRVAAQDLAAVEGFKELSRILNVLDFIHQYRFLGSHKQNERIAKQALRIYRSLGEPGAEVDVRGLARLLAMDPTGERVARIGRPSAEDFRRHARELPFSPAVLALDRIQFGPELDRDRMDTLHRLWRHKQAGELTFERLFEELAVQNDSAQNLFAKFRKSCESMLRDTFIELGPTLGDRRPQVDPRRTGPLRMLQGGDELLGLMHPSVLQDEVQLTVLARHFLELKRQVPARLILGPTDPTRDRVLSTSHGLAQLDDGADVLKRAERHLDGLRTWAESLRMAAGFEEEAAWALDKVRQLEGLFLRRDTMELIAYDEKAGRIQVWRAHDLLSELNREVEELERMAHKADLFTEWN